MAYRWLLSPKWLLFIPLLVVLVIGVACGGDEATSTPQPTATPVPQPTATPVPVAPAATATPVPVAEPTPTAPPVVAELVPKYGGIVPMSGFGNPLGLYPPSTNNVEGAHLFGPIYNQVVHMDPLVHQSPVVVGDLAKNWDISEDGLAYTFHLHENVKWTDGEELDADDVVFSINEIINPSGPTPVSGKIRPYVDRVEKIDKYTVRVHLNFPSSAFMKFFATSFVKVVPQHLVAAGVDLETFENIVGSGPFKSVEFVLGSSFEHERNPDYFKEGLPYFDGMKTFIITDKGTELAAYKTERVLMSISTVNHQDMEDIIRLEGDENFMSKFDIYYLSGMNPQYFLMNTNVEPFDDPRVRRAIFLAYDRQTITEGFGLGRFGLGAPMLPEVNPFALPYEELLQAPGWRQLDGKKHPDDIAEAKQLLKEAGYDESHPLKAKFYIAQWAFWPDAAIIIQEHLKNSVGIELEYVLSDITTVFLDLIEGKFQATMFGEANIISDPDDRFGGHYIIGGHRNWSGWSDPKVEELFKQQQRETDFEKRKQLNYEMQRIVINGAPGHIVHTFQPFGTIVSKRIRTAIGHYAQPSSAYLRVADHEHEWLEPK